MADEPKTGRKSVGAPQETDFQSMSHEDLLALIEGTNADGSDLAKKLSKAATKITQIGNVLRIHMTRVVWKGEAATAFENWGHQAAMATLELGKYSENAASWLQEVATAIAQAKSAVPKVDGSLETKAKESGDLAQLARRTGEPATVASKYNKEHAAALQEMERRRLEAAHQLQKLGQTYTHSGQQIMSMPPPQFPPPPGEFVPPQQRSVFESQHVGETRAGRQEGASETGSADRVVASNTESHAKTTPPIATVSPPVGLPERPADMEIDSVSTLPPPTTTTPTPVVAPPVGKPDPIGPTPGLTRRPSAAASVRQLDVLVRTFSADVNLPSAAVLCCRGRDHSTVGQWAAPQRATASAAVGLWFPRQVVPQSGFPAGM